MLFVKHVKSTVKKGCDVEIGPLTVLVGPNASGKSTIVQSIELGAAAKVNDMEGRSDVALEASLRRLFPSTAHPEVYLTLSDGSRMSWVTPTSEGKRAIHTAPVPVSLVWPKIEGVLQSNISAINSWVNRHCASSWDPKVELTKLGTLQEFMESFARDQYGTDMGRWDFAQMSLDAQKKATALKTAATRKENTVNAMLEGVNVPLSASDRAQFEAELQVLTRTMAQTMSPDAHQQKTAMLQDYVKEYNSLEASAQCELSSSPDAHRMLQNLNSLDQHLERYHREFPDSSRCWTCGREQQGETAERHTEVRAVLGEMRSEHKAWIEAEAARSRRDELFLQINELAAELAGSVCLSDQWARAEHLQKILAKDNATQRLLLNARAQMLEIEADRDQAAKLDRVVAAAKKIAKVQLLAMKSAFESRVQQFLPSTDVFKYDHESGRMGFLSGKEFLSALSGAEWTRMVLALASAGVEDSTLNVLMPPDRGWDRDTLYQVMCAMRGAPMQVILMSTVEPDPVEGWTILRTGRASE